MSDETDPLDELLGYPGSRDDGEDLAGWCARIGDAWLTERNGLSRRCEDLQHRLDEVARALGYEDELDATTCCASPVSEGVLEVMGDRGEYARRVRELESQVARIELERGRAADRARAMRSQRDADRREVRVLRAALDSALAWRMGGDAHGA